MSETRQCIKWSLYVPGFEPQPSGMCYLFGTDSETSLSDRVVHLGLTDRIAETFVPTNPAYFGWFIESPLNKFQKEVLELIIAELAAVACRFDYGMLGFLSALRLSMKVDLDLNVAYTPPGHVDFGIHTIHCHCPRCKAAAPINRWQKEYPTEPMDCPVCGFTYSPAETHSRSRCLSCNPVTCASCHHVLPVSEFSEEDQARIERYSYYRGFEAEMRMIKLVKDTITRHPEIEELPFDSSRTAKIDELLSAAQTEEFKEDDLTVLQYLRRHSFNCIAREGFLASQLSESQMYLDNKLVICPSCSGALF